MSNVLNRAKVLLDEGLTPGYWASWEEHPAQPLMLEMIAEIERLAADSRRLGQANLLLARVVAAANLGAIDGQDGFIESYSLPVGPIHKAIPFLHEQGIAVTNDGQIKNCRDESAG